MKYRISNTVNRVKRPILSLISLIIADEPQNHTNYKQSISAK